MFDSAWCLVMKQIQLSLIKKIKIRRPGHSLRPNPLRPITFHFCLPPPPTFKMDVIWVSPLTNWPEILAGNYMFKVNNKNTRTRCEKYSKSTIKTPGRRRFGVVLVSLLLTLNIYHTLLLCFYCQLWTWNCWMGYIINNIPGLKIEKWMCMWFSY